MWARAPITWTTIGFSQYSPVNRLSISTNVMLLYLPGFTASWK